MANEKYSGIKDGRKVVISAGQAVQLSGGVGIECQKITLMAEINNTSAIVYGGDTVVASLATRRGIPLDPGQSITIAIRNLNRIWLDAESGGDGISYVYFD